MAWTDDTLLELFDDVTQSVRAALDGLDDWGLAGTRAGQYRCDLAADAAALGVLDRAGVGVLSEESGLRRTDRDIVVVIDPIDGSTNAAQGVPWFATSLCAVDRDGPRVALVVNQASGVTYRAVRGEGAQRDGAAIRPSRCDVMGDAIVALSGLPNAHWGWRQFRVFGAAALDMCLVADGVIDGFVDCSHNAHGVWDYVGALLICREAGAVVADAYGRDLVVIDHAARRTPIAASTQELGRVLNMSRKSLDAG